MRGGANVYSLPDNLFVSAECLLTMWIKSRSMCAILADTENHRFLIGTNSFKRDNEIHLINYSEDSNRIDQEAVFTFDGANSEVLSLSSSPYNRDIFAAGLQNVKDGGHFVALYDITDVKETSKEVDRKTLKTKLQLGGDLHKQNIHSIVWEDVEVNEGYTAKELVTADSDGIVVWDLATGQPKSQALGRKVAQSSDTDLG
jgi:hypothetical protein